METAGYDETSPYLKRVCTICGAVSTEISAFEGMFIGLGCFLGNITHGAGAVWDSAHSTQYPPYHPRGRGDVKSANFCGFAGITHGAGAVVWPNVRAPGVPAYRPGEPGCGPMGRAAETPATGQKATGQGLADGPEEGWGLADVAWPMAWL